MNTLHSARTVVMAVGVGLAMAVPGVAAEEDKAVRPAYCAGRWYPGAAAELTELADRLLGAASPPGIAAKPVAVIAPHAGYQFSAPVAAAAYK